jgi:hypothetical protein
MGTISLPSVPFNRTHGVTLPLRCGPSETSMQTRASTATQGRSKFEPALGIIYVKICTVKWKYELHKVAWSIMYGSDFQFIF